MMLETIHSMIENDASFAFETTLSEKIWGSVLRQAAKQGYKVSIYFLYLESVKENLKRIKDRTRSGGHHVPDETVKRRYPKAIENFWKIYRPLTESWFIFNNSGKKPKLIHSKESFESLKLIEQNKFQTAFLLKAKGRR
jgi:predicted ABC-type ATPase